MLLFIVSFLHECVCVRECMRILVMASAVKQQLAVSRHIQINSAMM